MNEANLMIYQNPEGSGRWLIALQVGEVVKANIDASTARKMASVLKQGLSFTDLDISQALAPKVAAHLERAADQVEAWSSHAQVQTFEMDECTCRENSALACPACRRHLQNNPIPF